MAASLGEGYGSKIDKAYGHQIQPNSSLQDLLEEAMTYIKLELSLAETKAYSASTVRKT